MHLRLPEQKIADRLIQGGPFYSTHFRNIKTLITLYYHGTFELGRGPDTNGSQLQ